MKNKSVSSKNNGVRPKPMKISKPPFIGITYFFMLLNIVAIIGAILAQNKLPPEIPLYYGLPRSTKQLATPLEIIIPLGISASIIMINNFICLFTNNDYLKRVLLVTSYFITIMSIITVTKIIFLVGNF